jgi:protein-S-isoprenylcysteine O-methyltransferase Ste14
VRRSSAAMVSAAFFVVAPGTVVGVVPWSITHWELRQLMLGWTIARVIGILLICLGLVPLVHAFVRFVQAAGTPMPLAPPRRLVITGFNRYVRNPMYIGLLIILVGQALLFGNASLLAYAAVVWLVSAMFVRWYEEPALTRKFGREYERYQNAVPAWWPQRRPWIPNEPDC